MKQQIVILAYLICSALVYALPISDSNSNNQQGLDIVQIPLDNNKELDILSLNEEGRLSERNKRTIGILRDLFPDLSKQIEEKVNQIVGQIIRALGPTILRTAIQGNANRARNDFDSDFDDDDDNNSSSGGTRVQIDLPTFTSDDDDDDDSSSSSSSSSTSSSTTTTEANKLNANGDNSIDLTALNQQLEETIRVARQVAATQQENSIVSSSNDSGNSNNNNNNNNNDNNNNVNDQLQSASESKAPAIDELTLDTEDDPDDRNKRFLNLGFGGTASGGGASAQAGGSVAGSGNFLFDIIRRTADRAARAAGTVYRVVAGTEKLDLNNNGSLKIKTKTHLIGQPNKIDRTARTINDGLFSGSIQPQGGGNGGDERANDGSSSDDDNGGQGALSLSAAAAAGVGAAAGGGYTEGIPGPVTRLVVLANRGLANLIQDLILRIAATSERLVNFKARLITALI